MFRRQAPSFEQTTDWEAGKADGGAILDVREPQEWAMGTLPDAIKISRGVIPNRLDDLPEEKILVVCRSGNRSMTVANWLSRQGYEVANLTGGLVRQGMRA